MKKILSLMILAMMAISFPVLADDSKGNQSQMPLELELHDIVPTPTVHRAPMRISVEAYYDMLSGTISIYYSGEATGEVLLYKDGQLMESSSEINTTFIVPESGLYTIEIITDSWTASGSIDIERFF